MEPGHEHAGVAGGQRGAVASPTNASKLKRLFKPLSDALGRLGAAVKDWYGRVANRFPWVPELIRWAGVGTGAVAIVVLADVGRLIGDVESAGLRAFRPNVFSGFHPFFWDVDDLRDAINLWRQASGMDGFDVSRLLSTHIWVDSLFLVPAYVGLFIGLLRKVGADDSSAWSIPVVAGVIDEIENALVWFVLVNSKFTVTNAFALASIHLVAMLKWSALTAIVLIAIASWHNDRRVTAKAARQAVNDARRGDLQSPLIALRGLLIVTSIFAAFVTLPGDGALNQLPDVIRGQVMSDAPWRILGWPSLGLLLLSTSVAAAGLVSTHPPHRYAKAASLHSKTVVLWAGVASIVLVTASLIVDHAFRLSALAPLIVATTVYVIATLARFAKVAAEKQHPVSPSPTLLASRTEDETRWVGALSGAILVAGGLGLVRAGATPWIVQVQSEKVPWWLVVGGGIIMALIGGYVMAKLVHHVATEWHRGRRWISWSATVATLVVAAWLAVEPEHATKFGTTGALALGFAVLALVVGGGMWLSRRYPAWRDTQALGFGMRTPVIGLLMTTWGVASFLNREGVYHDARVSAAYGPSTPAHENLEAALASWLDAQTKGCPASETIPMVFVAAPGGGIRAAYWTAAALDRLLGTSSTSCTGRKVFAISGVSGGAVGATIWTMATASDSSGRSAVARIASDHALAATATGLMLRDLYQPFLAVSTGWRDRAALHEDSWADSLRAISGGGVASWAAVGKGRSWIPVLALNSSSVSDGCRIIMTNVALLPASAGSDCLTVPDAASLDGPVTGAIDPLPGLYARSSDTQTACGERTIGVRAVTAALIASRFPLVSPSGALLRCVPRRDSVDRGDSLETYAVDGGYYENSGIVTLLQLWNSIQARVTDLNHDGGYQGHPIEPWFVILDNHYRSGAAAGSHGRPLEVVAPFKALGQQGVLHVAALEQMLAATMRPEPGRCAAQGSAKPDSSKGGITKQRGSETAGCVVAIAPATHPSVSAPLGWVLSKASQRDLDGQLERRFKDTPANASVTRLAQLVGSPPKP